MKGFKTTFNDYYTFRCSIENCGRTFGVQVKRILKKNSRSITEINQFFKMPMTDCSQISKVPK